MLFGDASISIEASANADVETNDTAIKTTSIALSSIPTGFCLILSCI